MAINNPSTQADPGFIGWLKDHPTISISVGAVAILLLVSQFLKAKSGTGATSPAASSVSDLSGLSTNANGQSIVYVPTQTTFTTTNTNKDSIVNSPGTTTAAATVNVSNPSGTTNVGPPTVVVEPPHPVVTPVPVHTTPAPAPVTHKGGLVWDQHYSIMGGQTLSGIASTLTASLRSMGMPSSITFTYNDLYAHNKSVIDAAAAAHGSPIPGGSINNIFPGEVLVTPRWDKTIN